MPYARPPGLYDRDVEWSDLIGFVSAKRSRLGLGLVYGRRRFGNSFLLRRLVDAVGGVYHLALEESRAPALGRFAATVGSLYTPAAPVTFDGWDAALRSAVGVLGKRETPQLLILDEYPYLRAQSPELDSVIQALVDDVAGGSLGADWQSRVSIIVCGSAFSVMTDLLSGTAPLRGRAVLDLPLHSFDYRQSRDFWQVADPETAFLLHSIVGGAAGYRDLTGGVAAPERPNEIADWSAATILNPSHALSGKTSTCYGRTHEYPRRPSTTRFSVRWRPARRLSVRSPACWDARASTWAIRSGCWCRPVSSPAKRICLSHRTRCFE